MSRGQGMGKGGGRQRLGPTATCRCPKCGHTTPHRPGTPCTSYTCPKCGSRMTGV